MEVGRWRAVVVAVPILIIGMQPSVMNRGERWRTMMQKFHHGGEKTKGSVGLRNDNFGGKIYQTLSVSEI